MEWAFSDESERAQVMLLSVLFVPVGAIGSGRKALRRPLLPGQRQVHTSDESTRRRRQLLDTVAGLEATAVVYTIRRPAGMNRVEARRVLLTVAAVSVVEP